MNTTSNRLARFVPVAAAAVVALTGLAVAGPLNPPAGPVASTGKTLTEVEPRIAINATNTPGDGDSMFKITQSGSYYLTGNITGVVGKHGIEIAASGVTVDLNGFELQGIAGMGAFDGMSLTTFGGSSISVRNGTIRDWGGEGIDFASSFGTSSTVTDIRAFNNVGAGITVGNACIISKCVAANNDGIGIVTSGGGFVTESIAYANGGGISVGVGSTVTTCNAYVNSSMGILAGLGSTVTNCTTRSNTLHGIEVGSQSIVLNNVCTGNGNGVGDGAGINVAGSDNRIEGNNCTGADGGIRVLTAGNIIIKNTCAGNTINWSFVANNAYGPIIDRSAPASAAVSGNAAASTLGSADPNANFTY